MNTFSFLDYDKILNSSSNKPIGDSTLISKWYRWISISWIIQAKTDPIKVIKSILFSFELNLFSAILFRKYSTGKTKIKNKIITLKIDSSLKILDNANRTLFEVKMPVIISRKK